MLEDAFSTLLPPVSELPAPPLPRPPDVVIDPPAPQVGPDPADPPATDPLPKPLPTSPCPPKARTPPELPSPGRTSFPLPEWNYPRRTYRFLEDIPPVLAPPPVFVTPFFPPTTQV